MSNLRGVRHIFNITAAGSGVITSEPTASIFRIHICVAGHSSSTLQLYRNSGYATSANVKDPQAFSTATVGDVMAYENITGDDGGLSYTLTDSGGTARIDVIYYE